MSDTDSTDFRDPSLIAMEARAIAAEAECARLRAENEQLRKASSLCPYCEKRESVFCRSCARTHL